DLAPDLGIRADLLHDLRVNALVPARVEHLEQIARPRHGVTASTLASRSSTASTAACPCSSSHSQSACRHSPAQHPSPVPIASSAASTSDDRSRYGIASAPTDSAL